MGTTAVQRAESGHIPFALSRGSKSQQERQRLPMAMGKIPQREGPPHSWQINYTEPMPVATVGGLQMGFRH